MKLRRLVLTGIERHIRMKIQSVHIELRWVALCFVVITAALAALAQESSPKFVGVKTPNVAATEQSARLKVLDGHVLLGRESGLESVEGTLDVAQGMRVITLTDSRARVSFDDGCDVEIGPNRRYVVDESKACGALVMESILLDGEESILVGAVDGGVTSSDAVGAVSGGVTSSAAVGLVGGGLIGGPLGPIAGLAGLARIIDSRLENQASPN